MRRKVIAGSVGGQGKTGEMLLNEISSKSIIQKDVEQVSVTQAVLEAAHQKITQADKRSLSNMHKK